MNITNNDKDIVNKYLPGWHDDPTEELNQVHVLAAKFLQISEGYSISDIDCAFNHIAFDIIKSSSFFRI